MDNEVQDRLDRLAIVQQIHQELRGIQWEQLSIVELRNLCTTITAKHTLTHLREINQRLGAVSQAVR